MRIHSFVSRIMCTFTFIVFLPLTALAADAAQPALTPEFTRQLRQLLAENPDIVLDVLRENSETMLDIVQQGSDQRRRQSLIRQWQSDLKTPKAVALDGRPTRGAVNAPVKLIAFSDFTCAYCQQAAVTVENLLRRYPSDVSFTFKQSPSSDIGRLSSSWFLAAARLDTAKAWKFYALLFDRQNDLLTNPQDTLVKTATDAGFDAKAIEKELTTNAKAIEDTINVDQTDAKRLGFSGTPYFLVNDLVIRGALPFESFIDAIEMAKKAKK